MAVAVVTGAGAGVGRATAREFARQGYDLGLVGRDADRLEAAADEVRALGGRACIVCADVADAAAVDAAADAIEHALGPIDVWVNNAMSTVFATIASIAPEDFRRATEVTYLGTVYGTMAALKRMRLREHGTIINVGAALAYRAVPLQAVASGAKAAVRGFTDALRSELQHDGSRIRIAMVHLPAVNTPQFDWTMNRTGRKARPFSPVYQPEMPARAIAFVARHHRREVWVGWSTVAAIVADRLAPALADRALAYGGFRAQLSDQREPQTTAGNLYAPVAGAQAAHGRFDVWARDSDGEIFTSRHRAAATLVGLVTLAAGLRFIARRVGRQPGHRRKRESI